MPIDPVATLRKSVDDSVMAKYGKAAEEKIRSVRPELLADPDLGPQAVLSLARAVAKKQAEADSATPIGGIGDVGKRISGFVGQSNLNIPKDSVSGNPLGRLLGAPPVNLPNGNPNPAFRGFAADQAPLLGAVAGAPLGPEGSALGAGVGAIGQSAILGQDAEETARNVRNQMAFDIVGGKLFDQAFAGARGVARWLRGDEELATRLAGSMKRLGIDPSLQDISSNPLVSGSRRVLGVIPLINPVFRKAQSRALSQAEGVLDRQIESLSPDLILIRDLAERDPEAAAKLTEKAQKGFFDSLDGASRFYKKESKKKWDSVWKRAEEVSGKLEEAGLRLSGMPDNTLVSVTDVMRRVDGDTVTIELVGKDGKAITKALPRSKAMATALDYIDDLKSIPEEMTFRKMVGLKRGLQDKIDEVSRLEGSKGATDILVQVKEGVERDIESVVEATPALKEVYDEAKNFSSDWLTLLAGAASQRAKRTQATFGVQRASVAADDLVEGGVLRDEGGQDFGALLDSFVRSGSPREIRQFAHLVREGSPNGDKILRDAVARRIDIAKNKAFEGGAERGSPGSFNADKLRKALGFDDPNSSSFTSTVALMKEGGMSPKRATDIVNLFEAFFGEKNAKVSQYLQRRVQLGGASALAGGILPGVGAAAGAASGGGDASIVGAAGGAVLTIAIGRGLGRFMTDPVWARRIMQMTDPNFGNGAKARVLRAFFADEAFRDLFDPNNPTEAELIRQGQNAMKTSESSSAYVDQLNDWLSGTVLPSIRQMKGK